MKKASEIKSAKEKAEMMGKPVEAVIEEEISPSKMTEGQIY
jgi:hypothetical protein